MSTSQPESLSVRQMTPIAKVLHPRRNALRRLASGLLLTARRSPVVLLGSIAVPSLASAGEIALPTERRVPGGVALLPVGDLGSPRPLVWAGECPILVVDGGRA